MCNRLNLLLIDRPVYEERLPGILQLLHRLGITASLPPHSHPRGYEWSLDSERAATVTIDAADGPSDAARIANEETSGLAAAIVTDDPAAAARFIDAYGGSRGLLEFPTRLLDGFKLLRLPETGINIDRVPGPRGPVSFRDLYLRQYVVVPSAENLAAEPRLAERRRLEGWQSPKVRWVCPGHAQASRPVVPASWFRDAGL
ncbi:Gamma-glutamyl phosphate reductase [Streptomyces purpurascens]